MDHDAIWNRTVNLSGGLENMGHSHGNFTDVHVDRSNQMVGNLSSELDERFQSAIAESHFVQSKTDKWEYEKQVFELVEEYRSDCLIRSNQIRLYRSDLFDYISGRSFKT